MTTGVEGNAQPLAHRHRVICMVAVAAHSLALFVKLRFLPLYTLVHLSKCRLPFLFLSTYNTYSTLTGAKAI